MSFLIDPQNRCRPHLQDLFHGGRTFPSVLNLILEIFTLSTSLCSIFCRKPGLLECHFFFFQFILVARITRCLWSSVFVFWGLSIAWLLSSPSLFLVYTSACRISFSRFHVPLLVLQILEYRIEYIPPTRCCASTSLFRLSLGMSTRFSSKEPRYALVVILFSSFSSGGVGFRFQYWRPNALSVPFR